MVTKEQLSQLRSLKGEMALYDQKLRRLEREEKMYAAVAGEDAFTRTRRMGYIKRSLLMQEHYLALQSAYGDLLQEMLTFIASIPNSLTRRVFTLRYIEGESWQQVCVQTGREHSADALRMRHDHYLRRMSGARGEGGQGDAREREDGGGCAHERIA